MNQTLWCALSLYHIMHAIIASYEVLYIYIYVMYVMNQTLWCLKSNPCLVSPLLVSLSVSAAILLLESKTELCETCTADLFITPFFSPSHLTLSLCCECCATMMNFQAVLCSPSIRSCGAEINHLIRPAFPYRAVREIHHAGHMGRGRKGRNQHQHAAQERPELYTGPQCHIIINNNKKRI